MKTVVFFQQDAKIAAFTSAYALRAGYLLANQAVAGGNLPFHIAIREIFAARSLKGKMDFLEDHFKQEDGQNAPDMNQFRETFKMYSAVKHPTPDMIKATNVLKRKIENIYKDHTEKIATEFDLSGLPQLVEMMKSGELGAYDTHPLNPEVEEEGSRPVSTLLKSGAVDDDDGNPLMFFLTTEFFYPGWLKECTVAASGDPLSKKAKNIYYINLMTLPNLNMLTVPELRAIRKELEPVVAPFRAKVNEWLALWKTDAAAEDTVRFLENEVMPLAAALSERAAGNEMLKKADQISKNDKPMKIHIGMMPLVKLWDYYRFFKAIKDETWTILEAAAKEDDFKNRRVPVLLFEADAVGLPYKDEAGKKEKPQGKKSLSID